jgi:hypothetical protein
VIANVERLAKLFLSKTVYAISLAVIFGVLLWPFPFLPRNLSVVDGLTIPISRDFLQLGSPSAPLVLVAIGVSVVASLLLELAHRATQPARR